MTLAILYASKYGATREVADRIADACVDQGLMKADVETMDLARHPALPQADAILIGAPIYAGSVPRAVTRFVDANLDALLERRVGLYLSCLYDGDRAEQQLADNFPPRLVAHSFGRFYTGGKVVFDQMRWLDRVIMKKIAGVDHDVNTLNADEIARAAGEVISHR